MPFGLLSTMATVLPWPYIFLADNAGFNANVQRIAGIYPQLDRLLSYLLARRQWYVCRNTNHTTSFIVCL